MFGFGKHQTEDFTHPKVTSTQPDPHFQEQLSALSARLSAMEPRITALEVDASTFRNKVLRRLKAAEPEEEATPRMTVLYGGRGGR